MRIIIKDIAWIIANNFVYYKMKHFVYELFNSQGEVEYVGETGNPNQRFYSHTKKKAGKFYGRTDISMRIVKDFDNKKEAFYFQCNLQKEHNLETDIEKRGNPMIGKTHSIETKLKIGLSLKGKPNGREGILHNTETKSKMSEAMKLAWVKRKSNCSTI